MIDGGRKAESENPKSLIYQSKLVLERKPQMHKAIILVDLYLEHFSTFECVASGRIFDEGPLCFHFASLPWVAGPLPTINDRYAGGLD